MQTTPRADSIAALSGETMTSSINFIRTMVTRVKETFQLKKYGPPSGGP